MHADVESSLTGQEGELISPASYKRELILVLRGTTEDVSIYVAAILFYFINFFKQVQPWLMLVKNKTMLNKAKMKPDKIRIKQHKAEQKN